MVAKWKRDVCHDELLPSLKRNGFNALFSKRWRKRRCSCFLWSFWNWKTMIVRWPKTDTWLVMTNTVGMITEPFNYEGGCHAKAWLTWAKTMNQIFGEQLKEMFCLKMWLLTSMVKSIILTTLLQKIQEFLYPIYHINKIVLPSQSGSCKENHLSVSWCFRSIATSFNLRRRSSAIITFLCGYTSN